MPVPRLRVALICALLLVLALPASALAFDAAGLQRELGASLAHSGAAGQGALVRDLDTGATLYARNPDVPRIPASVEKLFTTASALRRFGTQGRLTTRVVRTGTVDADGRLDGDLVLVGGGDPTLGRAAILRLAQAVRRAGIRRVSGGVLGDASRFDARRGGPRTGGAWDWDMGGVLGALTVDRGFVKGGKPPELGAARRLARMLRSAGVRVSGETHTGEAPSDAPPVASVRSAPMATLVRRTNVPSDNFYAETLLKDLGAAYGDGGTTAAGAAVARGEAGALGARPTIVDGSGLSRANRASPREVVTLLTGMHESTLGPVFSGSLAVAGRTGTLRRRLRGTPAAGACRAKTGTLNGVSNLAGLCTSADGHTLAFAILMNGVAVWRAHAAQDRATAAIAAFDSLPFRHKLPAS